MDFLGTLLALVVVWYLYVVVTTLLFYRLRHHPYIVKRSPSLVILATVCGQIYVLDMIFRYKGWAPLVPSIPGDYLSNLWCTYLGGVTAMYTSVFRCIITVSEYHDQIFHITGLTSSSSRGGIRLNVLSRFVINVQRRIQSRRRASAVAHPNTRRNTAISFNGRKLSTASARPDSALHAMTTRIESMASTIDRQSATAWPPNKSVTPDSSANSQRRMSVMSEYFIADATKFTKKAVIALIVLQVASALIGTVLMGCIVPLQGRTCGSYYSGSLYLSVFWMAVYVITMPVFLLLLYTVPDSFGIRTELTLVLLVFSTGFTLGIAASEIPSLSVVLVEYWGFEHYAIMIVMYFILHHISVVAPMIVAAWRSAFNRQRLPSQAATASGSFAGFDPAMLDAEQYARLKLSAAQDFNLENILFYEEYTVLAGATGSGGTTAPAHFQTSVKPHSRRGPSPADLYVLFVKSGAQFELNLADSVRRQVAAEYAKLGANMDIRSLFQVKTEVVSMIQRTIYPRFMEREAARG